MELQQERWVCVPRAPETLSTSSCRLSERQTQLSPAFVGEEDCGHVNEHGKNTIPSPVMKFGSNSCTEK